MFKHGRTNQTVSSTSQNNEPMELQFIVIFGLTNDPDGSV